MLDARGHVICPLGYVHEHDSVIINFEKPSSLPVKIAELPEVFLEFWFIHAEICSQCSVGSYTSRLALFGIYCKQLIMLRAVHSIFLGAPPSSSDSTVPTAPWSSGRSSAAHTDDMDRRSVRSSGESSSSSSASFSKLKKEVMANDPSVKGPPKENLSVVREEDPDDEIVQNDDEEEESREAAMSVYDHASVVEQQKKLYFKFVESFMPEECGGTFEDTLLCLDAQEEYGMVDGGDDESDSLYSVLSGKLFKYRVLPECRFISCKILVHICRLPEVFSLSDRSMWEELLPLLNSANGMDEKDRLELQKKAYHKYKAFNQTWMYYDPGALVKAGLSALKGSMTRIDDDEMAPCNFESWIYKLYYMCTSEMCIHNTNFLQFRSLVLKIFFPFGQNGLGNLFLHAYWDMLENAQQESVRMSVELVKGQAKELDLLYAGMVHGAAVKVPMIPDLWCAHHHHAIPFSSSAAGRESEQFFKVPPVLLFDFVCVCVYVCA